MITYKAMDYTDISNLISIVARILFIPIMIVIISSLIGLHRFLKNCDIITIIGKDLNKKRHYDKAKRKWIYTRK